MTPEQIIAWLRSEEGEEWSRSRAAYQPTSNPPHLYRDGQVNPLEDPCGRPPLKSAATEEAA